MKRLLRAMLYAALPILGVISFAAVMYVAYIICVALGLNAGMCMGILFIVFAYMAGVFVFYKMDE
jgi:hypothetical protein